MSHPNVLDSSAPLAEPLRRLAERGTVRRYRKGTLIIQEGDQGDALFVILSGRVRAFGSGVGEREITYGTYGSGEYVGEMSLDGGPRSASVITLEATSCAVVTRDALLQHITEHPAFAFELLAKVIRRARAATLTAKGIALNDVYGRLVQLLNLLAVPQADSTRLVGERLTHQEIANRIGCSREMVSRVMQDLVVGGYVRTEGPHLRLTKPLPARW